MAFFGACALMPPGVGFLRSWFGVYTSCSCGKDLPYSKWFLILESSNHLKKVGCMICSKASSSFPFVTRLRDRMHWLPVSASDFSYFPLCFHDRQENKITGFHMQFMVLPLPSFCSL